MTESPIQMKPHPLKTEVTEQKRASLYLLGDSSGSGIEDEDEQSEEQFGPETSQGRYYSMHKSTTIAQLKDPCI